MAAAGSAGIPLCLVMQGISRPHYQTQALAAEPRSSRLKASAHPLLSRSSRPFFFSSRADSGEAMSRFIHSDASHTILNPSRRRGSGSANFNKFVAAAKSKGSGCPELKFLAFACHRFLCRRRLTGTTDQKILEPKQQWVTSTPT